MAALQATGTLMLALEIRLNGDLKARCGAEGLDNIVAWMRATRRFGESDVYDYRIECTGSRIVDPQTSEFMKWVSALIQLGDEVSLRFVEVPDANAPIDRQEYPSPETA
jgi:hypothetical protein